MKTTTPAPADLQRWSEELAGNPTSLAFLPLARAYRRQGRLDLAMSLCQRGLEQNPAQIEARELLALLYLETGDHVRAVAEWSMILQLDADDFGALRGMGYHCLEQRDLENARRHLERAARIRPTDTAVKEALQLLRVRTGRPTPAVAEQARTTDPTLLFDAILEEPMLGVLLVDGHGRVLAGRLAGAAAAQGEAVGALIGGTADEAARVVEHLGLGRWKGLMLECGNAVVQLSPASGDAMLVIVARRDAPRGWLARTADRAMPLMEPLLRSET